MYGTQHGGDAMKRVSFAVFTLIFVLAAGAAAHADGSRSPWVFDVDLRLWGLDLGVGYRGFPLLQGVDTTFWGVAGGAYEKMSYYRQTEAIIIGKYPGPADDLVFYRADAKWWLGVAQGLLWNERIDENRLEALLFYRGRFDENLIEAGDLIDTSDLPDESGLFQNTLFAGLAYNDILVDKKHKTKSGISGEISAEWGPAFLANTVYGSSDFVRFNATARGFFPLYDAAPDRQGNLFSMYLGEFFSADYAIGLGGTAVPYVIRRTFGGKEPRTGLGYAVRGVDSGSLDTNLKLVNNFELRMNLPAIVLPDIVPGALVHWDVGYFSQVGESIASPQSGFVSTVGAGVFVNLFDIATLAAYIHYRLDGVNADGSALVPFDLQFGLHF